MRNIVILLVFVLLFFPKDSFGIVKRDDITEQKYLVVERPEYLIDMPHEGHGVLIKPNWILTVAHEIFYDYTGKAIIVSGNSYKVDKVVIHSKYKKIPNTFLKGSSLPLMEFNYNNNDIALIRLTEPVKNRHPIEIYNKSDELGKEIEIYGNGATGNGLSGQLLKTKTEKKLRYCRNTITEAKNNWLVYKFDEPSVALDLEGMHGSGDSGGPSIVYIDKTPYLVGLSAWQYINGKMGELIEGLYGTMAYQVRVSHYSNWISNIVNENTSNDNIKKGEIKSNPN